MALRPMGFYSKNSLLREIITTADGSTTIQIIDWEEQYHSKHGAIQEAYHVFIAAGLSLFKGRAISILEMGFGTGLNAFITYLEAPKLDVTAAYVGVEAFPVPSEELGQLNYISELKAEAFSKDFLRMHEAPWEKEIPISERFSLHKKKEDFVNLQFQNQFDLVYFDAFGARVQPELWTEKMFSKMFDAMTDNGVLVTYSAKGSVRRAMQAVGFYVERLPGPPGKREMLRAVKRS